MWDEHNEAHIAHHADTLAQTDDRHRPGRLTVWGSTVGERHLLVILDPATPDGDAYVVTARPMTDRERRNYEEAIR